MRRIRRASKSNVLVNWKLDYGGDIRDNTGILIARVYDSSKWPDGQVEKNARLIVAAPRMLKILQQITTRSYSVIDMAKEASIILRDVEGNKVD